MKHEVIEKSICNTLFGEAAAQGVGQLTVLPESRLENNTQKYVYEGKATFNSPLIFILSWVSFCI